MNKAGFAVIFGLLGAAIGSISTYFVMKKHEKEAINEAENAISKFYIDKYVKKNAPKKPGNGIVFEAKNEENELEKSTEKVSLSNVSTLKDEDFKGDTKHMDYTKYSQNVANYKPAEPIIDINFPQRITKEMWENDIVFDKVYLTYYEESGVFTDPSDALIQGMDEDYFGLENLSGFGDTQAKLDGCDDYTLYFRDAKMGRDYEVYYEPTKSYEEVLSMAGGARD